MANGKGGGEEEGMHKTTGWLSDHDILLWHDIIYSSAFSMFVEH